MDELIKKCCLFLDKRQLYIIKIVVDIKFIYIFSFLNIVIIQFLLNICILRKCTLYIYSFNFKFYILILY